MTTKNSPSEDTHDREIVTTRVFDAPRELVWEAWTNPKHVANWWGPRGFTTSIETMDVRPGGKWEQVMIGPDGTRYPNKSSFKEVVKPERIVYLHGGGREGGKGATFVATWTFEEVGPGKTRLTARMVFPSAEDRDFVAKEYGAVEGGQQTFARLAAYLPSAAAGESKPFVLSRVFDAPRDVVWKAWTEPQRLQQWFGPKGFSMPTCSMDLRPGGVFLYCLKSSDGEEMWGKWVFREIVAPSKLVVLVSFSDANAGVTRHPMAPIWPLETLSTMTLDEENGKTRLTLVWTAYNASLDERNAFDAGHESMKQGWGGTMDQLDAYLAAKK
ncbi:MAG: hypothetical protein JWM32_1891 [Verrucomicrobia bacterium]|nr:hypothetical protein [Verrucomicrobiota bacterium]